MNEEEWKKWYEKNKPLVESSHRAITWFDFFNCSISVAAK